MDADQPGGQGLGGVPGCLPMGQSEDFYGLCDARQLFGAGKHGYFDLCSDGLLKVREIGMVGLQVDRCDSPRFRGGQVVDRSLNPRANCGPQVTRTSNAFRKERAATSDGNDAAMCARLQNAMGTGACVNDLARLSRSWRREG